MLLICSGKVLTHGGKGYRFSVLRNGVEEAAFAIRYKAVVYAYLNRCAHVPTELDWIRGDFFESDGRYLICGTHGALYAPESGFCVGGRCNGKGLIRLPVIEADGLIYCVEFSVQS